MIGKGEILLLNRNSYVPLYVQLADEIRRQIISGEIKPGDKLLSESEMIKTYQLGRLTVREALSILENEGLIEKQHGRGSFCKRNHSLKKRKITVLLNTGDFYFIPYYLNSICKILGNENVDVVLGNTRNNADTICDLLKKIVTEGADGVILQPNPENEAPPAKLLEVFDELEKNNIPYIMIDNFYEGVTQSCVLMDEFEAGRLAARYLLDNGHTKMCMICRMGYRDSDLRLAGFMTELDAEPYMIDRTENMTEAVEKMIKADPEITGIYCYNDVYARDFYRAAEILSLPIPERFSVVSTDDTVIASTLNPRLTCIAHPKSHLGKAAAKAMLDMIAGKVAFPYIQTFIPTVKERQSCKKL